MTSNFFLKCLLLNSKLDIPDNFPNDGTVFPTASKKSIKKLKAKKLAGGHMYPRRYLVVNACLHSWPGDCNCICLLFAGTKNICNVSPKFTSLDVSPLSVAYKWRSRLERGILLGRDPIEICGKRITHLSTVCGKLLTECFS